MTRQANGSLSPLQAWILAARPKTLPASIVPVLVGSVIAFHSGAFRPLAALMALLFALFAQIAANFVNDLADGRRGNDREEDRKGPQRMVASGQISPGGMLIGTIVALGLAALGGIGLIYYGGVRLILVGAVCLLFAILYSAGPFPLSYYALGDVLVFLFFGLVATGFTFYVQTGVWTREILWGAIAVGLATDNILIANNYRDRDEDRKNRKFTLIALFGERFGRLFYLVNGLIAAIFFALLEWDAPLTLLRHDPSAFREIWLSPVGIGRLLLFLALPILWFLGHFSAYRLLNRIRSGPELIPVLGKSAQNLLRLGVMILLWGILG